MADLIKYRRRNEHLVRRAATVAMPTRYGDFKAVATSPRSTAATIVAIVKGDVAGEEHVFVRVHSSV